VYLGYKLVIDPLFIESLDIKGKGVDRSISGAAPTVTVASPEGSITPSGSGNGELSDGSTAFHGIRSTLKSIKNELNKLNPSYWFLTSNSEEFNSFIDYQKSNNYNRNLYPHSKFNPYDNWVKRMRIYYFGETVLEKTERRVLKYDILNSFGPITMGQALTVSSANTPQLSPIGLNLTLMQGLTQGFAETANKIASLPSTPGMKPLLLDNLPELDNGFNQPLADALNRLNNSPENPVILHNKFEVLDVE